MDNEDYLRHIAAQARPAAKSNRFLTPVVIRLLAGAVIALVMIIVLGVVLSSVSSRTVRMYERLHLRVANLSSESGPLTSYGRSLKSSDLRSLAGTLKSSLTGTARDLGGILVELKVDTANISEEATSEEAGVLSSYTSELDEAQLNGLLDRTFAAATTLQISLLISMESEVREKTNNTALTGILDRSMADLEALLAQFTNYGNSH